MKVRGDDFIYWRTRILIWTRVRWSGRKKGEVVVVIDDYLRDYFDEDNEEEIGSIEGVRRVLGTLPGGR